MKNLLLAIVIIALVALIGTFPLTILSKIFDWLSKAMDFLARVLNFFNWNGLLN